jgi:Putative transposase of IS4/5 family (DUF4096)
MRYELADHEWMAIKPMLPNKPRRVPRVNDRRVLNGIFWVLRSGAWWGSIFAWGTVVSFAENVGRSLQLSCGVCAIIPRFSAAIANRRARYCGAAGACTLSE